MALAIPSAFIKVELQPRRKRKKTKERKDRLVRPCKDGICVNVFCSWGCGVSYKSHSKHVDQKAWAKTLRKLNAHESQRCPCNPHATRVSGKAKAKKRAAVDELMHDWETVLLGNHVEILQQQIRFLRALPTIADNTGLDVGKQIDLLQGSLDHTKDFIATITSDEKVREARKLKAAKLASEERARMLKAASRRLTEAESMESGVRHIWTEPTFADSDEWQKELDEVIEMEEAERTLRMKDEDTGVGVFWTHPTEPSAEEHRNVLAEVIAEEEKERELRVQDPAHPDDPAVGVFWTEESIDLDLELDLLKTPQYARTAKIEATERVRRMTTCSGEQARQAKHVAAFWPQFTKALRRRFPERNVQPATKPVTKPATKPEPVTTPRLPLTPSRNSRTVPMLPPLAQIHSRKRMHQPMHQAPRFPIKRPRGFVPQCNANVKNRRLHQPAYAQPMAPPPRLRLDADFDELQPLCEEEDMSPPSSFTDNDEFLIALDELLEIDTSLFLP